MRMTEETYHKFMKELNEIILKYKMMNTDLIIITTQLLLGQLLELECDSKHCISIINMIKKDFLENKNKLKNEKF